MIVNKLLYLRGVNPNVFFPKGKKVTTNVLTAAKEVKNIIILEGFERLFNINFFVLMENINSSSVNILSINHAVLSTSGLLDLKIANNKRSKTVLTIPRKVAIITISVLL